MSDAITGYAQALLSVAQADGNLDTVRTELTTVSEVVSVNDELRRTLGDRLLPAGVRGQIVDDLLANRTTDTTRALVGMIVGSGRGSQLSEIVAEFVRQAATQTGRAVANVRTAVPLSEEQQTRLAAALAQSTGTEVDLQVVVDPSVVGGAVTTIGDTVIDGSLRSRLNKMRDVL